MLAQTINNPLALISGYVSDHVANLRAALPSSAPQVVPDRRGETLADMAQGIAALRPGETIDELIDRVKAATGYDGGLVVIW
ncbi:hypothetical protein [Sphingomonas sp. 35-24ZXX]|uniref:hypothetical protein n=1 Tax=Sphingomonas sp. 35-24ZXX TaxID=1545915 RepID=UPI000AC31A09|nr:hypothetical protein [Sphingomonas sp. 35-24ZXX]